MRQKRRLLFVDLDTTSLRKTWRCHQHEHVSCSFETNQAHDWDVPVTIKSSTCTRTNSLSLTKEVSENDVNKHAQQNVHIMFLPMTWRALPTIQRFVQSPNTHCPSSQLRQYFNSIHSASSETKSCHKVSDGDTPLDLRSNGEKPPK